MLQPSKAIGIAGAGVVLVLTSTVLAGSDQWRSEREERFGPWSAPVNLGAIVNSAFQDAGPAISRDGLSLYFHSLRHSAGAEPDLFVMRRAATDLPWGTPVNLGALLNSTV